MIRRASMSDYPDQQLSNTEMNIDATNTTSLGVPLQVEKTFNSEAIQ